MRKNAQQSRLFAGAFQDLSNKGWSEVATFYACIYYNLCNDNIHRNSFSYWADDRRRLQMEKVNYGLEILCVSLIK